ncbi:hypothetical protein RFM99_33440 [Mesorhizobium sp. VK4C]|uniref:hypothetical protein n=1 Tax=Mesorhizobium captivum TaxID=3072319 RepID=UPI002A2427C1|nr:hypothetical protein [Mesorhizobium sp. VK4C]MDX8503261.1 hypothetical protein [Mesorhizobium sp. VK4C]
MTRIAFVAAAMLVAAIGSAFAGSDHYGADGANQTTAGVDKARPPRSECGTWRITRRR